MHVDFPYRIARNGRTASTSRDDHIRDLIEQVLFTAPGERVNRPEFGSGVMQLVFAPNSPELATATKTLVQGSLQRWLGDVIAVEQVDAESFGGTLEVTITYLVRDTGERQAATFTRET